MPFSLRGAADAITAGVATASTKALCQTVRALVVAAATHYTDPPTPGEDAVALAHRGVVQGHAYAQALGPLAEQLWRAALVPRPGDQPLLLAAFKQSPTTSAGPRSTEPTLCSVLCTAVAATPHPAVAIAAAALLLPLLRRVGPDAGLPLSEGSVPLRPLVLHAVGAVLATTAASVGPEILQPSVGSDGAPPHAVLDLVSTFAQCGGASPSARSEQCAAAVVQVLATLHDAVAAAAAHVSQLRDKSRAARAAEVLDGAVCRGLWGGAALGLLLDAALGHHDAAGSDASPLTRTTAATFAEHFGAEREALGAGAPCSALLGIFPAAAASAARPAPPGVSLFGVTCALRLPCALREPVRLWRSLVEPPPKPSSTQPVLPPRLQALTEASTSPAQRLQHHLAPLLRDAVKAKACETVRLLLAAGAEPTSVTADTIIAAFDGTGRGQDRGHGGQPRGEGSPSVEKEEIDGEEPEEEPEGALSPRAQQLRAEAASLVDDVFRRPPPPARSVREDVVAFVEAVPQCRSRPAAWAVLRPILRRLHADPTGLDSAVAAAEAAARRRVAAGVDARARVDPALRRVLTGAAGDDAVREQARVLLATATPGLLAENETARLLRGAAALRYDPPEIAAGAAVPTAATHVDNGHEDEAPAAPMEATEAADVLLDSVAAGDGSVSSGACVAVACRLWLALIEVRPDSVTSSTAHGGNTRGQGQGSGAGANPEAEAADGLREAAGRLDACSDSAASWDDVVRLALLAAALGPRNTAASALLALLLLSSQLRLAHGTAAIALGGRIAQAAEDTVCPWEVTVPEATTLAAEARYTLLGEKASSSTPASELLQWACEDTESEGAGSDDEGEELAMAQHLDAGAGQYHRALCREWRRRVTSGHRCSLRQRRFARRLWQEWACPRDLRTGRGDPAETLKREAVVVATAKRFLVPFPHTSTAATDVAGSCGHRAAARPLGAHDGGMGSTGRTVPVWFHVTHSAPTARRNAEGAAGPPGESPDEPGSGVPGAAHPLEAMLLRHKIASDIRTTRDEHRPTTALGGSIGRGDSLVVTGVAAPDRAPPPLPPPFVPLWVAVPHDTAEVCHGIVAGSTPAGCPAQRGDVVVVRTLSAAVTTGGVVAATATAHWRLAVDVHPIRSATAKAAFSQAGALPGLRGMTHAAALRSAVPSPAALLRLLVGDVRAAQSAPDSDAEDQPPAVLEELAGGVLRGAWQGVLHCVAASTADEAAL